MSDLVNVPQAVPPSGSDQHTYLKVPKWAAAVVLCVAAAGPFLVARWVENEMRAHYERQMEEYRREAEIRSRAALIAEYLSMWHAARGVRDTTSMENVEFYQRLNKLSFELALFLPADVYRELGPVLAGPNKDIGTILISVRRRLLKDPGALGPEHVIYHWPGIGTPKPDAR